jgi:hypothetical protein
VGISLKKLKDLSKQITLLKHNFNDLYLKITDKGLAEYEKTCLSEYVDQNPSLLLFSNDNGIKTSIESLKYNF